MQYGYFDDQNRDEIHTIIQKMVFPQGGMAAGFDREWAVNPLLIESDRLIDHIPVASFEPVVNAPSLFNKLFQTRRGH